MEEGKDIQALIDQQKGGFQVQPWDWELYSEQVRKAKYDIDQDQVKPYFEMWNVLQNGVFYAANQLYGITFKERKDIPVYNPDVRVFEVFDANGKPLALWYCDYFKRDNKAGGAWMDSFVSQSKLLGTLPVIYNVANFQKPSAGEPALISFDDVTTAFHEFGHALHGMFADAQYPMLSGTAVPRDFVEFPSQFNEHWASNPAVFDHYAKHYKTGAAMPAELAAKLRKAATFNQGYMLTEILAFEKAALERKHLALVTVPPRYRSTLLPAYLGEWVFGRLLRVPVERDAGRRCIPVVRGPRRTDAGEWRPVPQDGAVEGQHRGPGEGVLRVAGWGADYSTDVEGPRAGRGYGCEVERLSRCPTSQKARCGAFPL